MNSRFLPIFCAGLCPAILPAGEASGSKVPALPAVPGVESKSHFRVSAGAGYRSMEGVEFRTGSRSGGLRLPFLATALSHGSRTAPGGTESYADREYSDGYVRQDAGTAQDGSTWNWGFAEESQITHGAAGQGRAVAFHGQASSSSWKSQGREEGNPGTWEAPGEGAVPVVRLEWFYDFKPEVSAGVSLQYSFLAFEGEQSGSNFRAWQMQTSQEASLTDFYELGNTIAPQAPYEGTYEGPGPLINNLPSRRQLREGRPMVRSEVQFFNEVRERVDVRLHQFTLGPTVMTRMGPVQLALGAGLSLNVADWEAEHTETLFVRKNHGRAQVYKRWSDQTRGTDVLPGVYLQFAATVPLTSRLSVTAFGNHDWSRTLSGEAGPSPFTIDPTGWTLGGMIGYSF